MAHQSVKPIFYRPPIVTILGHVDHGKTTLLDTIRKTAVAAKEYGGITQHIGTYEIEIPKSTAKANKLPISSITFIDTPGHEAFARMRVRGANVADVAVLVVAGNDGVQPQTVESIDHIKAAKIPVIVAINKIDLPNINIDKIKKQLLKLGLNLEEYGGETPLVPLSAKTGQGIDKLLEMILVLSELNEIKDQSPETLSAVIIESTLTKNRGVVATLIVRNGSLKIGDELVSSGVNCRVRSIVNWKGEQLPKLSAGRGAEILGFQTVPTVGGLVTDKNFVAQTKQNIDQIEHLSTLKPITPDKPPEEEKMKIIVKSDTAGTLEALASGLKKDIEIISSNVGPITESDILLAKTTGAIVVGFHVKPSESVIKLAQSEKVIVKTYNIIYELFQEIAEVATALRQGNLVTILGQAQVIALFPMKDDLIAGVKVISGRIAKGDQVKIVREQNELGRAKIKSLRHLKEDINKATQGTEAGVILSQKFDLLTGDSIISIG